MERACVSELLQQRAEANQRHEHDSAELSSFMLSRTVAEQEVLNLRKELSEANTRLKNATNSVALEAEQRANQKVSHVTGSTRGGLRSSGLALKQRARKQLMTPSPLRRQAWKDSGMRSGQPCLS